MLQLSQGFLTQNRTGLLLDSLQQRLPESLGPQPAHYYSCGLSCQPFSSAGKRKGLSDKRGLAMFRALQDRLRELMALHPDGLQGVLLEQVPGLLKSKDAWDTWSTGLLECLPGFVMFTATLNSLDFMVPQSRKRLYIVLLRASSMMQPYVWPQPTGQVTLASILQTEAEAKEDKKHKGIGAMKKKTKKSSGPCTTAKQKERLKRQLQCLRTARYNPNSILAAIDIDSGWKGRRWRIGYTPTITRSRGGSGGSLRSTAGLGIVSRCRW